MQTPDKPHNEAQRIKDLEQLEILDSNVEERYDRITRLAKRLFDVPISVISLVDKNRQWFKSRVGIDAQETERDISFCGHAILDTNPFIVSDTLQDDRFADNPLVVGDPGIRFYAGVPLLYNNGSILGTLCIIDTKPRKFAAEQLSDLIDLGKIIEKELISRVTATTDALTMMSNQLGFLSLGQKMLDYCNKGRFPISLAYFDLDNFTYINQEFGSEVGDEVLKRFAKLLEESFRDSDVFARIRSDEFVVLMSGSTEMVANIAIERFTRAVELFNQQSEPNYRIAFSVGVSSVKVINDTSLEMLIDDAIARMQQQQKSRNVS